MPSSEDGRGQGNEEAGGEARNAIQRRQGIQEPRYRMAVVHDPIVRFRDHKLSRWTGLNAKGKESTNEDQTPSSVDHRQGSRVCGNHAAA
jgi:hypothetical protein